jgi:hypothetical protein
MFLDQSGSWDNIVIQEQDQATTGSLDTSIARGGGTGMRLFHNAQCKSCVKFLYKFERPVGRTVINDHYLER